MKKIILGLLALVLVGCSSGSNTATTNDDNTFVVGMECDYAPFNWTQVDENEHAVKISNVDYCDGYDVVMAQRIADELDQELVIKKVSWDNLVLSINQGDIDAIIAGMTATPERKEQIDFTDPYYESQMVVVVKEDSELANITNIQELSGYRVLGQMSTLYDEIIDQIEGVNHLTPQRTYPRMVLSLNANEADALTAELPVAQGVVAANPGLKIVTFEDGNGFNADTTVSIGVAKDSPLLEQINSILANISQEERNQIMLDATNRQPAGE